MSRFREAPDKTLEWAAQLPPEDSASVIGAVLPGQLRQAPAEGIPRAMDWLEGLPAEQLGKDYAANVAKCTARAIIESTDDPQAAANWAANGVAVGIALTGNRDRSPATSGEPNTQTSPAQALEQAPDFLAMNRGELVAALGKYDDATLRRTIRAISSGGSAIASDHGEGFAVLKKIG